MIAIYARQSLDKKDSLSIESQIEMCKQGEDDGQFLVFQDKGFSGKNTDRPGFQEMMDAVRKGQVEKIVVYKLDRLSRNIGDFADLWEELDKYHVQFSSIRESFDTTGPMGKAMVYIILTFAQLERETTALRVKDNYYMRIRTGSWPGGPAPYGFDNARMDDGTGRKVPTLAANENMDVVERIFYEYAQPGTSLGSIAHALADEKILTPSGKKASWDSVAIGRILRSPVYVQADVDVYFYYKSRGVENFSNDIEEYDGSRAAHVVGKRDRAAKKYTDLKDHVVSLTNFPGRIPSDIWLKCQYKMDHNRQIKNSGTGKYSWISGYIKCAKCGYGVQVKPGYKKIFLSCIGKTNYHICDVDQFDINYTDIENAVQKELEALINDCGAVPDPNGEVRIANSHIKMEIAKIDEKIGRLVTSLSEATDVVMGYINKEIGRLDAQKRALIEEADQANRRQKRRMKQIVFDELDMDEKRMAVDAFIEKILVSKNGIEIIWKV